MFGIAIGTILGYSAATAGGGIVGAWLHAKWLQVKAAAVAEEATIKARLAALEAAVKPPSPPSA